MKMPFGKHKGKDMDDVPADYLMWVERQDWIGKWPEIETYIRRNIDGIKKQMEDRQVGKDVMDMDGNLAHLDMAADSWNGDIYDFYK